MKTINHSGRALAHIKVLAEAIGPRPAGSEAEGNARAYVQKQLQQWGYHVQKHPVSFAALPLFSPFPTLAGLYLALGGWGIATVPWLLLGLPFAQKLLIRMTRWMMWNRPQKAHSENLVVFPKEAASDTPILFLCAHLDSARVFAFRHRFWIALQTQIWDIYQRVAIAITGMAILHLLGLLIPDLLVWLLGLAGSVVGGGIILLECWNQFGHQNRYAPGANDNASGLGVVLALAEFFARQPVQNIRLGFLFTGAEETGLHGARAFAEYLSKSNTKNVYVLNLDMVGVGDVLKTVVSDGTLPPTKTSAFLNELVANANPQVKEVHHVSRSGDHLPFLKQGIAATTLEMGYAKGFLWTYHTLNDTLETIDPQALQVTAETIIQMIEKMIDTASSNPVK
ncbi:MAG: Zn-dependent exopeptidase M28 [Anaerolineales bacterium]|nr:Zn-dependent exopeptidase M28 [Anaerolineales bacterium]